MAPRPTPRPWWWLAELTGLTESSHLTDEAFMDCPWCGGPSELVPWHPSSSVRTTETAGSNARAGIAFARASCLFGHWFLVPTAPAGEAGGQAVGPAAERGRR